MRSIQRLRFRDPLAEYRKRRKQIAEAAPEDLLLFYRPGMESWTAEKTREEGEKVRVLALREIDNVIAEEESYL